MKIEVAVVSVGVPIGTEQEALVFAQWSLPGGDWKPLGVRPDDYVVVRTLGCSDGSQFPPSWTYTFWRKA